MSWMDKVYDHVDAFQRQVLLDALNEAAAGYWLRRAEQFAAVGNRECDEVAKACRNRAKVALIVGEKW